MSEGQLPKPTVEAVAEYNRLMHEHRDVAGRIGAVSRVTGSTVNAPQKDRARLYELSTRLNELRETYDFSPEPTLGARLIDTLMK